jgi:hypothetical protein
MEIRDEQNFHSARPVNTPSAPAAISFNRLEFPGRFLIRKVSGSLSNEYQCRHQGCLPPVKLVKRDFLAGNACARLMETAIVDRREPAASFQIQPVATRTLKPTKPILPLKTPATPP